MRPIFLIGYMASGKTTLGRALAKKLNLQFIDLDFYISQRFRSRISDIFEKTGEAEFRKIESSMLREVGEFENVVIACGGGTPCFNGNMDYINSRGTSIFLEATPQRIISRLLVAHTRRPLVENKTPEELHAFILNHLEERLPYYRRASITIPSDQLESRAQIDETMRRLLSML